MTYCGRFEPAGSGVSFALVLLAFLAAAPASVAQRMTNDEARLRRRIEEADRDLHSGSAERALRAFEELLAQHPESGEAFAGVVESRIRLHRLDGLDRLVLDRLAAAPADPGVALLLGDVRSAEGRREDAIAAWREALPLFDDAEKGYREIARRMEGGRMYADAIAVLEEGRGLLALPNLFAEDLAPLLALTGDGDAAAREWVRAAASGARKEGEAIREIREIAKSGEMNAYPFETLRALVDSDPAASGLREILAWLSLDDGRCSDALREFDVLDRTLPRCGRYLLTFAKEAIEKGCLEEGAEGAGRVAERCDDAGIRMEASFLLGRIRRNSGEPEKAAEIYRAMLEKTPSQKDRDAARFELASTLLDDLGNPAEAIPHFEELLRRGGMGDKESAVRDGLARARLLAGDPEGALRARDEMLAQAPDDAARERALFEKGQALFLAGKMDEALAEYRRVVDQYPAGRYLNDALIQSIFISENRDAGDAALKEYAACLLLIDRKEYAGARSRLDAMLEALVVAKLRDDLIWRLALLDEEEGKPRDAVERLERLVAEFPKERLAQNASVRIADLWCGKLGDLDKGIARYEEFLLDYPESVLVEEARRKKLEAEKKRQL